MQQINVLDHGYVKYIESWGSGATMVADMEAGIIEAARQSTQGSFRGWKVWHCNECEQTFYKKGFEHHSHITHDTCTQAKGWSNDSKLLEFMYKNQHATPFEFAGLVIEVQAPIFVFREWQRHRTQSYNEMSARYAPLPDMNYIPTKERLFQIQKNNTEAKPADGAIELTDYASSDWIVRIDEFYQRAEQLYQDGLAIGIPKEIARICLPVGRYSKMRASANLRNWLQFLTLRAAPNAQWEIQEYARAVSRIIEVTFPQTFQLWNESMAK